jgi:hypothetical protein
MNTRGRDVIKHSQSFFVGEEKKEKRGGYTVRYFLYPIRKEVRRV